MDDTVSSAWAAADRGPFCISAPRRAGIALFEIVARTFVFVTSWTAQAFVFAIPCKLRWHSGARIERVRGSRGDHRSSFRARYPQSQNGMRRGEALNIEFPFFADSVFDEVGGLKYRSFFAIGAM